MEALSKVRSHRKAFWLLLTTDTTQQYREARYQQSLADNGNFFFGPGSLLLYGAASFLYELMPTAGGIADEAVNKPCRNDDYQLLTT